MARGLANRARAPMIVDDDDDDDDGDNDEDNNGDFVVTVMVVYCCKQFRAADACQVTIVTDCWTRTRRQDVKTCGLVY